MRFEIHERINLDHDAPSRTLVAVDVETQMTYMQRCPLLGEIPSSGWYKFPNANTSKFGYLGIGEFDMSLHPDSP